MTETDHWKKTYERMLRKVGAADKELGRAIERLRQETFDEDGEPNFDPWNPVQRRELADILEAWRDAIG